MTAATDDDDLRRALRLPLEPPPGLAARIVRDVRRRSAAAAALPSFDLAASPAGLVGVRPGRGRLEAPTARARRWAEQAHAELAEFFAGERSFFTVPLDVASLGRFQRAVLDATRAIPFGEVRSYRWVAEQVGAPAAVRAVGTALGRNPVPFFIACHRVLRTDGSLGGYGLGLPLKERLLALERDTPALVGCATTRILCRHGCPHAQRIAEPRRVVFASVADARSVGYRPCKVCRPQD